MRFIRFKKEKQQINFLNCDNIDKWVDTCVTRESDKYDICSGECECNEKHYLDIEGRILLEHNNTLTYHINNISFTSKTSPLSTTLEELGISEWTSAYRMFSGRTNLTSVILLPSTSAVTNMNRMFAFCSGLTSLDLSSFDTSNVTDMTYMFIDCSGLTSLDLSSFDTSNVTIMQGMFQYCTSLTSLDLSGWDMGNVTDMRSMFSYCNLLKTIYMRGCDSNTISKIENALTNAYIRNNVTIIT